MHHSHFLLSAKARTLSMREVFAMSDDQAFEAFREVRWGRDGEPECPACGVVAEHWFLPSRRQWRWGATRPPRLLRRQGQVEIRVIGG